MEILNSIVESLAIDYKVVIAQAASLILLMVVLMKFLYRPVETIMRQRQEQIANSLAGAEAQQLKADSLRKEYEGHLANIADEARAKLDQAMKDAEVARERLLESTRAEIEELHQRHQAQLSLDREQLRRDLQAEMSNIAVLAASKALRNQLTPNLQSAVIDQVIQELDITSQPHVM